MNRRDLLRGILGTAALSFFGWRAERRAVVRETLSGPVYDYEFLIGRTEGHGRVYGDVVERIWFDGVLVFDLDQWKRDPTTR